MIAKPVAVFAVLASTLFSCPAIALEQHISDISCDVISAYAATSPAYLEVFRSYLEGYLVAEKNGGKPVSDDRDPAALMSKVIAFCGSSRDSTFASAIAASVR